MKSLIFGIFLSLISVQVLSMEVETKPEIADVHDEKVRYWLMDVGPKNDK